MINDVPANSFLVGSATAFKNRGLPVEVMERMVVGLQLGNQGVSLVARKVRTSQLQAVKLALCSAIHLVRPKWFSTRRYTPTARHPDLKALLAARSRLFILPIS
ncbi:MAG: hypothetical protein INR73_09675 [Williamsia sp.]|nr:hypothetical protein [Williamsia sp.]